MRNLIYVWIGILLLCPSPAFAVRNTFLSPPSKISSSSRFIAKNLKETILTNLKDGTIQSLFGFTNRKNMDIKSITPSGDLHSYFTIHEVKYLKSRMKVTLSYVKRDKQNNGICIFENLTIRGAFVPNSEKAFSKINKAIIQKNQELSYSQSLYLNQTTHILLEDNKGQEFSIYCKYGPSVSLEKMIYEILELFKVNKPKYTLSKDLAYLFTVDLKTPTLRKFVVQNYYDHEFYSSFPYVEQQKIEENILDHVTVIGQLTGLMILLGNEDFFSENVLFDEEKLNGVSVIDLEASGQAYFFSGRQYEKKIKNDLIESLIKIYYFALFMLEKTVLPYPKIAIQASDNYNLGVYLFFKSLRDNPEVIQKIYQVIDKHLDLELFPRIVLSSTGDYDQSLPIPHISMPFTIEDFKKLIAKRYQMIQDYLDETPEMEDPMEYLTYLAIVNVSS